MANDLPCGQCKHFDPVRGPRRRPVTGFGRCVARSVYPLEEGPGQTFPPHAKRSETTSFEIVRNNEVVPQCVHAEKIK